MEHKPTAPWVLQQSASDDWTHGYDIQIVEPRNTLVATVHVPGLAHMADRKRYYARLIAAAPDLLKACQQALYALKGREHDGFLRDAIAKATEGPKP